MTLFCDFSKRFLLNCTFLLYVVSERNCSFSIGSASILKGFLKCQEPVEIGERERAEKEVEQEGGGGEEDKGEVE